MLSISQPLKGAGQEEYYLQLAREDYYAHPLEEPGRWLGKGAEILGLRERVYGPEFRNLLRGLSPHGTRPLVQNAGADDRQCGWDLTLSAPKSVSVAWALGPERVREEIERAHQEAVEVAMDYLERYVGITRRGKGGSIKEHAALAMATFRHGSSRALDPNLHTHCVLVNVACRADGTTGSVQSLDFFRAKMKIGRLYRDALAQHLEHRLGFVVEQEPVGFHIVGVPKPLCRELSKRSQAINIAMKARQLQGAIAAKVVAIDTRPAKQRVSRQELFVRWQAIGVAYGWAAENVQALARERSVAPQRGKILEFPLQQNIITPRNDPDSAASTQRQNVDGVANSRMNTSETPAEPEHSRSIVKLPAQGKASGHANAHSHSQEREGKRKADRFGAQQQGAVGAEHAGRSENAEHRGASQEQRGHQSRNTGGKAHQGEAPGGMDSNASEKRRSRPAWALNRLVRVQWRWMFPHARIGSVVDGWISPRLVILRLIQRKRWARVIWRKELLLGEIRVQQRRLFPKAPEWSLAKGWKLPAILFRDPSAAPRWGAIERRKALPLGEVRIQGRILFPDAPKWSPLHKISISAIRFAAKSPAGAIMDGVKQKPHEHEHAHQH